MMTSQYKQELGLKESIAIIIGKIIGSGIFKTPAPIMLLSGSVFVFFQTWIVGGILTFLSAMLYAEMVSAFPKSGGPYEYLKRAYHPLVPFLRGWAMFFVSETAAIVVVSIVFSEYTIKILQYYFFVEATFLLEMFLTIALIWFFTFFNTIGLEFSGWFQDVLSFLKMLSLFYIIIVCFSQPKSYESKMYFPESFEFASWISGMAISLRYALFTYSGWEGATYVAEEVKNPSKNLPLSLFLGIFIVMTIYLLTNVGYLMQLSPEEIANSKFVAAEAMEKALGPIGATTISFIIALNTAGNVNAQIFTKSRTWQAMSRDGLFFSFLAPLSSNSLPVRSLIFQAMWATVLTLLAYSSYFLKTTVSIYDRLIDFFSFTSSVFNILTIVAVWILRKKYPDVPRHFRIPDRLFYVVFFIVLAIYFLYAFYTLVSAFFESLMGIILTLSGLLYWKYKIKPKLEKYNLSEL
ncbi:MAG: amino acid permease [Leptospiraceae bacterium]|nr:amino acid permease [Leptospiraceae bacterium]MDW7975582.1 amino acid permease [Leptospiraceae bacterium]